MELTFSIASHLPILRMEESMQKSLGYPFVIKIQVPVGGRGKAGGIQKCQNDDEFEIKYPQVMDLDNQG